MTYEEYIDKVEEIVSPEFSTISQIDHDGGWVTVDGIPNYWSTYVVSELETKGLTFHGTAPVGENTTYYFKLNLEFYLK